MRDCDIKVATQSLWAAAHDLLNRFAKGWDVDGAARLPKEGPLLVVANIPARTFSPELEPREINTEIRRYVADGMTKTFELL